MGAALNLKGHRYGKLRVTSLANGRTKQGGLLWHCKCDCGGKTTQDAGHLRSGHTTSCGCKHPTDDDLSGKRFGILTVLHLEKRRRYRNKERLWHCKCDCGREVFAATSKLRGAITKSCSACQRFPMVDLVGKRFGDLVVIRRATGTNKYRDRLWECKCKCGGEATVATANLTTGHVTSCNCRKRRGQRRNLPSRALVAGRFQEREVVALNGQRWFVPRRFRAELAIGHGTVQRWKKHCKWLSRGITTMPLKDGNGRTLRYISANDADAIAKARDGGPTLIPDDNRKHRNPRNGRWTVGSGQAVTPKVNGHAQNSRRGRPTNPETANLYRACYEAMQKPGKRSQQLMALQGEIGADKVPEIAVMRLYARRHAQKNL